MYNNKSLTSQTLLPSLLFTYGLASKRQKWQWETDSYLVQVKSTTTKKE